MKTIKLPGYRKEEIAYTLNSEEQDTMGNLTNVLINSVAILVEFRYLKEEKEIELYGFEAYAVYPEYKKEWMKLPKELVDGVTFLLDEEKVKELALECYKEEVERMEDDYVERLHDERNN